MLGDVVLTQKREMEQRLADLFIPRDVSVPKGMERLVCVVLGPRRAGKSLYAMHRVASLGRFGYVNFDDERLARLEDFDPLLAAIQSVYRKPEHLLLDEVQNVRGWELLVNRLQRQGYRLTVTGSNAHLLSSELATHLTGRHLPIVLFPFSFSEYLKVRVTQPTEAEQREAFRSYAEVGGYPEPLVSRMPHKEYLTTLVRSTLYKDVVARHRVRAAQSLDDLFTHLMANCARPYSWNSLSLAFGGRSVHTLQSYVRYFEEAFLLFSVSRFSFKTREQSKAPRKLYCTDNGLVSSASFRFSADTGRLYENLVAIALRRLALAHRIECYYWQGERQEEVDFVVKQGRAVTALLQVCADASDPQVRRREIRSLIRAGAELKCTNRILLTESEEGEERVSWYGTRARIRVRPLWRWLQQQDLGLAEQTAEAFRTRR